MFFCQREKSYFVIPPLLETFGEAVLLRGGVGVEARGPPYKELEF